MKRNQTFGFSRAQKMINSIINEDLNLENNHDVPCKNGNVEIEYPVSPLESGAQYALEGLALELFHNSSAHSTEDPQEEPSAISISGTDVYNTPMPSPAMSFTASSPVHIPIDNDLYLQPDFLTSTPKRTQNEEYPAPRAESPVVSSDNQSNTMSESAAYSSGEIFSPHALRNRKRIFSKRKDVGRLRERFQKEWVDMKRKRLKNLGLEYNSRDGKLRGAKSLGSLKCNSKCIFKCSEKFTDSERQKIFDKFWAVGDHSKQWDVLARHIKRINKRRTVTDYQSRRSFTNIYYLPILNDYDGNIETAADNVQQRVCKTTFLQTFSQFSEDLDDILLQMQQSQENDNGNDI